MIMNPTSGGASSGGMSPYEYAVAGGFSGTEEAFQAALAEGPWIPVAGRLFENDSEGFNGCIIDFPGQYNHVEGNSHYMYPDSVGQELYACHISGSGHDIGGYSDGGVYTPVECLTVMGENNRISTAVTSYIYYDYDNSFGSTQDFALSPGVTVLGYYNGGSSWSTGVFGGPGSLISGYNNLVSSSDNVQVLGTGNQIEVNPGGQTSAGIYVFGSANNVCGSWSMGGTLVCIGTDNSFSYCHRKNGTPWLLYNNKPLQSDIFMIGRGLNHNNTIGYMFDEDDPDITGPGRVFLGAYNNVDNYEGYLIVGCGYSYAPKNGLRVTSTEVLGLTYKSSGADYAEFFEWADGNANGEDRCGRFVTLRGKYIQLAQPGEDFILGIISGDPSVVGDAHDDQWSNMNARDIFGRYIWEDVEVPDEVREVPAKTRRKPDPDNKGQFIEEVIEEAHTEVVRPAHVEHRLAINPEYDPTQRYIPRSDRKEWDAVGMMGKLVMVDDGTCEVDGWCTSGVDGVATKSEERTKYRVMERLDAMHIRVLVL